MSLTSASDLTFTSGETGWTFHLTHDWTNYQGSYSPQTDTGFLGQLLVAKPSLFESAISNHDYILAPSNGDFLLAVELKCIFETIFISLKSLGQVEGKEVKQLKSSVDCLQAKVIYLEAETTKLQDEVDGLRDELDQLKIVGRNYTYTPVVSKPELMRYAVAFYDPFKVVLKMSGDTTPVSVIFDEWMEGNRLTTWKLTVEYLARVRQLSMEVPMWSRTSQDIKATAVGMYSQGCWSVAYIRDQDVTSDRTVLGPFTSDFTTHKTFSCYWVEVKGLIPLCDEEKRRHNLA